MNVTAIIIATAVIAGVGLFIGIFLGIAGVKFEVEVDERAVAIREELPGANCGGCGFAGCDALAEAIAAGTAPVSACPVCSSDVHNKIASIMGVSAGEGVRQVAFVKCAGTCEKAKEKYKYTGVQDCSMAAALPGAGSKGCSYGCMGYGSCVAACPFDAIHVVDGIAVVDREACKACGKCVAACPKHLIELIPEPAECRVECSSQDKGKDVMAVCTVGCIGCGICAKQCPKQAITVENNIAHIDYETCISCGICAAKCPKGIITMNAKAHKIKEIDAKKKAEAAAKAKEAAAAKAAAAQAAAVEQKPEA